ncbi:sugar O-acyltransferase, sialic acid O-acetyltransferase NeuD family [Mesonia phycicola]|uniref:Sugar O-acyltransferase, sialic acid O-acetyltransferase NeuD family n=1 Tax=Mesonia phycicola TaxID=579105 RepID=A0A1M6AMX0_9FLAO|nr:acetyltransferase [Mesonia phycicola]SHI37850.1 sugar O-acyltransferase, sialic acid O-acetyltransferase NeuD family [Mesonia phycicola]
MLIIGAKGYAKELLEVVLESTSENIIFYDDVNKDIPDLLYGKFPVLKNTDSAKKYFEQVDKKFVLGLGNPNIRVKLAEKFIGLGGELVSTISEKSIIGNYGVVIDPGCNISQGVIITNDIKIGKGCLINLNATIGHDCTLGKFVEISPNVNISGNCVIGDYSTLGTNSIILPKINVGEYAIVGAGAVVTKDVPARAVVVGSPAKIIKYIPDEQ